MASQRSNRKFIDYYVLPNSKSKPPARVNARSNATANATANAADNSTVNTSVSAGASVSLAIEVDVDDPLRTANTASFLAGNLYNETSDIDDDNLSTLATLIQPSDSALHAPLRVLRKVGRSQPWSWVFKHFNTTLLNNYYFLSRTQSIEAHS
jgi:hypothetical protein